MLSWWWLIIVGVSVAIIVGIGTFVLTQKKIKKQLDENPPISAAQIRTMYAQMGRKPSEAKVRQIMAGFKNNNKK